MDDSDDDGPLVLSADALQALTEFRAEKSERDKRFEELKTQAEDRFASKTPMSIDLFDEDWNASQFWYTDATATVLAANLLSGAGADSAIAVVSAPSVYVALKNLMKDIAADRQPRVLLLEFDTRFDVFGTEFQPYDFAHPLRLPAELKGSFDRIICDPPFLSEDCQTKTALTSRFLAKQWHQEGLRFISCTGERMETIIHRLYGAVGTRTTTFEPE